MGIAYYAHRISNILIGINFTAGLTSQLEAQNVREFLELFWAFLLDIAVKNPAA
jgi:hypothetical protein